MADDENRARGRRWLRRPGWGTLAVLAATSAAMLWAYLSTHQIYPDTQLYLGWTYRLLGHDGATAERMVAEYIAGNASFAPYDHLFRTDAVHDLIYRPRLLLPALSVPFVALFGPGGIVVVPGTAFLAAMLLIYRLATGPVGTSRPATVAACCLALLSPLTVIWSVGALTDSLALLLHTVLLLMLPWPTAGAGRPVHWWRLAAIAAVCALAATARTTFPFTIAAVAGLWLWAVRRRDDQPVGGSRRAWTMAAAAAAAGVLAGLAWTRWASQPLTTMSVFTAATGGQARRYADLPAWYAEHLPGRLAEEGGRLLDSPPLVALITLSLIACVLYRRTVVPWLVVPAWLGALGVFMINPVATSFRYELPVLPALVVGTAVLVDQAIRLVVRQPAQPNRPPGPLPEQRRDTTRVVQS